MYANDCEMRTEKKTVYSACNITKKNVSKKKETIEDQSRRKTLVCHHNRRGKTTTTKDCKVRNVIKLFFFLAK